MPVDLHVSLLLVKLDSALLNGRLDVLPEDLALVGMMRKSVVPLAVLLPFDLVGMRYHMVGR